MKWGVLVGRLVFRPAGGGGRLIITEFIVGSGLLTDKAMDVSSVWCRSALSHGACA